MAYYYCKKPNTSFSMLNNNVLYIGLSKEALALYWVMNAVNPKKNYVDQYFAKVLGVSLRSLAGYKKELKDENILYVKKINKTTYQNYLGDAKVSGKDYMDYLAKEDT